MSEPLIDASDLGTYLNDDSLDVPRAEMMISYAQTLCESVISPLPAPAVVIVMRVAARGYVTITSARQYQLGMADAEFGTQPGPVGGVYLTDSDTQDLRRLSGGGGAFNIDILPAGYVAPVPAWRGLDGWDSPT